MDNLNEESRSDEYKIIFRNYSVVGKRKEDTTVQEYEMIFAPDGKVVETELPVLDKFGLYSVRVGEELVRQNFKITLLRGNEDASDDKDEEDIGEIEIVNSVKVLHGSRNRNSGEFYIEYNNGFIFADENAGQEKNLRICLEAGKQKFYADFKLSAPEATEDDIANELMKMVQQIYDAQPLLLMSVFQKAPLSVFLDKNSNIKGTIDVKLKLIEAAVKIYQKQYSDIRRARKFKLKEHHYIDRIDKLTNFTSKTMNYMIQNPQYLIEVKKKKGIFYGGKVYLPEKTLVTKNIVNYDIYENRYIVSFLKMLLSECARLKLQVKLLEVNAVAWKKGATNKSQEADYEGLIQKCRRQEVSISRYAEELKKQFLTYKMIFELDKAKDIKEDISKPRVTAIFRQLPEYNKFYVGAFMPWFEYGIKPVQDAMQKPADAFITAVSNPSTTYELYIVVKWLEYLAEKGYELDAKKAKFAGVHEKESRYSDDAYEFVMYKETKDESDAEVMREEITLFYSPSVYIPEKNVLGAYGISEKNVDAILFRNTRKSKVSREDKESNGKGAHYEPDFILKYQCGQYKENEFVSKTTIRYLMADAKHKDYDIVWKEDVPDLIYKYINSIKAKPIENADIKIAGLCAVYHKHSYNEIGDIVDEKEYFEFGEVFGGSENEPFTQMLYMHVDDEDSWQEDFDYVLKRTISM